MWRFRIGDALHDGTGTIIQIEKRGLVPSTSLLQKAKIRTPIVIADSKSWRIPVLMLFGDDKGFIKVIERQQQIDTSLKLQPGVQQLMDPLSPTRGVAHATVRPRSGLSIIPRAKDV